MLKFDLETGDLVKGLSRLDSKLRTTVKDKITELTIKLTNNIKSDKLTGQVLKVRTGRLRNSIKYSIKDIGDSFIGTVSTNVKYAAAHEYGFKKVVSVKSHLRTIKQAFGKNIDAKKIQINGFTRQMNIPERSFMRSALKDMRPQIESEIKESLSRIKL